MDKDCFPEHEALMSDFKMWQKNNPGKFSCEGKSVTEDGRLVLDLSIHDTKFRLLCPAGYPKHEDSFYMETECMDFWCIALNEFIIDFPEKLTIGAILAKAFLYYTPSSENCRHDSSDLESDNEDDIDLSSSEDSDSSEITQWKCIISKKKKEWRAKEGELRLKYNRPKISDMFDGVSMEHPQQVFSNSAASAILINDLINVMSSEVSSGIVVDPIDNNICRWSVFLKNFRPKSKISQDLKVVKQLYGYDHIQLELGFAMDLYPSHPPLLRFVKPKLKSVFEQEDFVKLANWNPARNMASVLMEIKDYIDNNGTVDIHNRHNGIRVGVLKKILLELNEALTSEPTYELNTSICTTDIQSAVPISPEFRPSPLFDILKTNNNEIELILIRFLNCFRNECDNLSLNCVTPDCSTTHSYFTFNLTSNGNLFDEQNHEESANCKPSCYSSLIFKTINRLMENETIATQSCSSKYGTADIRSSDRNHCNIITNPSFELGSHSQCAPGLQNKRYSIKNIPIGKFLSSASSSSTNSKNNDSVIKRRNEPAINQMDNDIVSTFNTNIKTPKELSVTVSNDSMLILNSNFYCVVQILEESVLLPFIKSKLSADTFFEIWRSMPLYSRIIDILIELASYPDLIDLLTTTDAQDKSVADLMKIQEENATLILDILTDIQGNHSIAQGDLKKIQLATNIIAVSKSIKSSLSNRCNRVKTEKEFSISNELILNTDSHSHQVKNLDLTYKDSLKTLQFCNCNIDLETHTFKNDYIADIGSPRNYFRVAQEFAVLSKTLPLELNSAIFVRIDSSKCFLMRALVTGSEDTCCSGCCFSFDIYLKKDYPNSRLEISCTTFPDGETCNLACCEVLDTLGKDISTQDADIWTNSSTILQVLTFIQTKYLPLRLSGEYLKYRSGKESGISKEVLITNNIQFGMIDQMRKPTPGFEDVIATHFHLKRDQILSELEQYEFLRNSEIFDSLKKEFYRLTCSQGNVVP
ncbi:uncharacterized protein [Neodiprion pinetum]|uniref:uncharacterized protein n=1 Tax=Neodiprion pinetum TaxID=441929 RepID=UPI001EDD2E84|nr:uncharacterized protein LOC124214813 [Neodiprion pinetum]XP_046474728.1 uncharacterized protein LOC124214813 [Neodiprion pinetum]XP_046475552.1 uncharacterized protein LOC124214813 [Neodiprion pinetum]